MNDTLPHPETSSEPLTEEATSLLLGSILNECRHQRVMFDLDSTLIDNTPRNSQIMREFASTYDQPLLAVAEPHHFPTWSARHTMALLGLNEQQIFTLIDPYEVFWAERFFTSDYCQYDEAIAGAVSFTIAIRKAGGVINYLTGRNETMRSGTQLSLQSLGFPVPGVDNVQLIMKPRANDSDDDFKHDTMVQLSQSETIVAAFDNEPTHINSYREVFPDAMCVHLDTDHSMREVTIMEGVVTIRDFGV